MAIIHDILDRFDYNFSHKEYILSKTSKMVQELHS